MFHNADSAGSAVLSIQMIQLAQTNSHANRHMQQQSPLSVESVISKDTEKASLPKRKARATSH